MLVRVAIAVKDRASAQKLTNRLISFSLRNAEEDGDIEFDLAYYHDLPKLIQAARQVDMAFLSYGLLEEGKSLLAKLYQGNPTAFSVPLGSPDEKICDFLALRPAGHLRSPDDQRHIDQLCAWCAEGLAGSSEVLQIKTKQGCHAVTASSILFCQSDQKYVMIVTDTGTIYRKLEKLDELMTELPDYFVRIHQSYLANARRITGLDKTRWELLLDQGNRLPVSRIYQKTIAEQIQKFLFDRQK